jgi:hypothetical protein
VRDVLRNGMFAADLGNAYVGGFAGFGEGIVARVEVLALLSRSVRGSSCTTVRGGKVHASNRMAIVVTLLFHHVKGMTTRTLSLFCSKSFLFGNFP